MLAALEDASPQTGVKVTVLNDPECVKMMAGFIRKSPELWNEDISQ